MQRVQVEAGLFVLPDEHPPNVFPHNIVVFGDIGVNATMTPEVLAEVAVGTCAIARDLIPAEVLPEIPRGHRVVLQSWIRTRASPVVVRQAMKLVPDVLAERVTRGSRYGSIEIEGEIKVSVALSERSARYYQQQGSTPWNGGTNVLDLPEP